MKLQTLAIVGVGLIGGSIGKAAKERGIVAHVVGIEANPASAEWALENGLIDSVASNVPDQADLIALCVPSDVVPEWVVALAGHPAPMFDVGSVKAPIVDAIAAMQAVPAQFLPCHPISGSEKSGPQAADASLFDGCTVVITPLQQTATESQQTCTEFWQALGASVVCMSSQEHDAALAATSHLPHLLAFAFMGQVTDEHLPLTGGGFRDFTRIAAAEASSKRQTSNNRSGVRPLDRSRSITCTCCASGSVAIFFSGPSPAAAAATACERAPSSSPAPPAKRAQLAMRCSLTSISSFTCETASTGTIPTIGGVTLPSVIL